MYQELASTAFLQVAYRPDSGLLIGRWLCSITEEQLREGYETMRLAALQHECHYWLMDARRRTDRRLNGPEWVVTTFLPRLQQEMGGPLCVAFLVLPNHLREVEEDPSSAAQNRRRCQRPVPVCALHRRRGRQCLARCADGAELTGRAEGGPCFACRQP